MATVSASSPLLGDSVHGVVDYKGNPATRSKTGRWSSSIFIIVVEVAERFAYYGVSSNLISYLTGPLGQSTAAAAENVNIWGGVTSILCLLGALVADSYLGRYRTIFIGSILYVLALGMLILSAELPSLRLCESKNNIEISACSSPSQLQVFFFFSSLYLMAIGLAAHKPCTEAFGADQFDEQDPKERKSRSSFFNWWYFGLCGGTAVSISVVNYVEDNLGWGLGFGIPCVSMGFGLGIFLLGTRNYRYRLPSGENPFKRIGQFFVAGFPNWKWRRSSSGTKGAASEIRAAGILGDSVSSSFKNELSISIPNEVKDRNWVLRLFPIWVSCLMYGVVFAQSSTFFTKQGATMDRKLSSNFQVPAASLQSFISLTVLVLIPIYDWILVPMARIFTRISTGITMLQRVGAGMFLSVISMAVAALVEIRRLRIARDSGLVDLPTETVPMSIWWLVPQYLLFGAADVFTIVGLQEFFYDQIPQRLRSLGIALFLGIFGVGSFLSGFLISLIDAITDGSWFSDNLNRAHLDYFYWLLCGLSIAELCVYLFFAKSYVYKRNSD